MVFHACLKQGPYEFATQYIVTAPDADTIDEWWRAVCVPANRGLGYERLAPDFYTWVIGTPPDAAPEFASRLIFTVVNDRKSPGPTGIPDQKRTDYRSGQSYFIRSKSSPGAYWCGHDDGGRITTSNTSRTRFLVSIVGQVDGTVMISKDSIRIRSVTNPMLEVGIRNHELHLGAGTYRLLFGDLKNNFLGLENGGTSKIIKRQDAGEEWELVR